MAQNPKIKFILDYKEDAKNALAFLQWNKNDPDFCKRFLPGYMLFILNKDFSKKDRAKVIKGYTKDYYFFFDLKIKQDLQETKNDWAKVAPRYFRLVDKIFKGFAWPKGEYKAIGSIYNIYPRYIESKTFYFPLDIYEKGFAKKVIAHEMMHFMFFAYLQKKYKLKQDTKLKGKPANYVWLLSEIFNYTLEQWAPYKKMFAYEPKSKPYFGNLNLCKKMHQDWLKNQDIDWLLDKWLK